MVAVFIDESGNFTPARPFSVVSALSRPHASLERGRRLVSRTAHGWPRANGELKGGSLTCEHLAALVGELFRQQAILHSTAVYIGRSDGPAIEAHKAAQCEKLTKHLSDEHTPTLKAQVWALREQLETMSPQLYVQCIAQSELLCRVGEDIPNYFAQREPKEIAKFEWFIDAKDKAITPQEKWWRDTLGPLMESRSSLHPFRRLNLASADYSHFDRAFDLTKRIWNPERPTRYATGTNIRKLVLEHLHFVDSKSDILVQAVDVLCRFIRRAMDGELHDLSALNELGRLQIHRRQGKIYQSIQMISLGGGVADESYLVDVLQRMSRAGRPMLTRRSTELIDTGGE
jgi:hypothetical protein